MARKSEFGRGCVYCLGLFLAHKERGWRMRDELKKLKIQCVNSWFNGSSDHLYDLEIPENLPERIKKRLARFQDKCLRLGHGFNIVGTEKDFCWAIQEAKYLLRMIDKYVCKVDVIKGSWE